LAIAVWRFLAFSFRPKLTDVLGCVIELGRVSGELCIAESLDRITHLKDRILQDALSRESVAGGALRTDPDSQMPRCIELASAPLLDPPGGVAGKLRQVSIADAVHDALHRVDYLRTRCEATVGGLTLSITYETP
jgi:hypothetical protein